MWEGSSNRHDDSGGSSRKAKRRIHHRHSTRSRAYIDMYSTETW